MSQQKPLIPKSLIDFELPVSKLKIEARSLQNFAAAIGDANNIYYDDTLPDGISSHPCYPITTTWPLFEQMMPSLIQEGLSPHAINKLVHYSENLVHHAPITPKMRLRFSGKIIAITGHKKGTQMHFKLNAARHGNLIFEDYTSIFFRGIFIDYPDIIHEEISNPAVDALNRNDLQPIHSIDLRFSKIFQYVYDGCTNIVFPIHTSNTFAQKVGLPGPIVQGSASFSRCISEIMKVMNIDNPLQIRQIAGQFGAFILPEENLQLNVYELKKSPQSTEMREIGFTLTNPSGKIAIKNGYIRANLQH
ncbi:MAG: FAS1-like dehydratase domain-containing protein [Promethearchaeota archaeon]